ncbi:MAG: magnesium transporter [bacterium]
MLTERLVATTTQFLDGRDLTGLAAVLAPLHPGDLADLLRQLPERDRITILLLLPDERAALVLESLDPDERVALSQALADEQLIPLLSEMATDEATDLLGELPADRVQRLLKLMHRDDATQVAGLMAYPERTAGGLMTTEVVKIDPDLTVSRAIQDVRDQGREVELLYYVYVTEAGRLVGVVTLRELIAAPSDRTIRGMMHTQLVTVSPLDDQEAVAALARKYSLLAVPVIDGSGRLLGVVTSDDLLGVVETEGTEDVLGLTGAVGGAEMQARTFPWDVLAKRSGFLVLNLFLDMLAVLVISRFTNTLEATLALAFFIPALMASAGNVGAQSLALAVRGLATGRFGRNAWNQVAREGSTGAVVGAVCGLVVGSYAAYWQQDLMLGIVVGGAMWLGLLIAAPLGMMIPLTMHRLGVDPAITSGPLITTIADILVLIAYFMLAIHVLGTVGG